ncbi:unnamed protein product, partial [Vitis vinifera]
MVYFSWIKSFRPFRCAVFASSEYI